MHDMGNKPPLPAWLHDCGSAQSLYRHKLREYSRSCMEDDMQILRLPTQKLLAGASVNWEIT